MINFFTQVSQSISHIWNQLILIINTVTNGLASCITYLDSVQFNNSFAANYLGYVHYIIGDVNYIALTSMFIIGIGAALWQFTLKGVGFLKNFLPW